MAFFVGPVDDQGNIDESKGHDVSCHAADTLETPAHLQYLARKIGEAGQKYAELYWSWAEMQSYVSTTSWRQATAR